MIRKTAGRAKSRILEKNSKSGKNPAGAKIPPPNFRPCTASGRRRPGSGKRGEDGHIAYLLRQAQAATRLTLERALADLGVTPPQFAVLTMLNAYPGLSGADVARVALLTPQTVGVIIGNLERDGAIRKTPHPVHGRVLQWTLTRRGLGLLDQCRRRVTAVEKRLVAGLGAKAQRHDPALVVQNCRRSARGWLTLPLTWLCRAGPGAVRLAWMTQADSREMPTRRALLGSGLAASALFLDPFAAFAATPPGFEQWRDRFRAHALAKGISDATWTRVMGRIEPDMSVFRELGNQPEFKEELWQYINRRVSDWRIINGREALRKNEALFAPDRTGLRRRARHAFGAVGRRIRLWRSAGAAEPYAPRISRTGGAGLERAAPPRLLGIRTDQCAAHRRSRLEHAGGNAGVVGRRDGTHPVDAGGLAQCRHRLRSRRPGLAVRQAGRCARFHRPLSRQPRQISPWRALGLRSPHQRRLLPRQSQLCGMGQRRRCACRRRSPSRSRTPPRNCGRRCQAARVFCWGRISIRCEATIPR